MQLELPKPLYHSNHKTYLLPVSISLSGPLWLLHTPQPTTYWNHQPQLSRAKMALQFILTIKVNAIGTAKTFVSHQSQDSFHFLFLYQPSSPLWLVHRLQPTTYWNHQPQQSRSIIALQFILTIKVNAIGTAKTFVSLHTPITILILHLSPSAFQSPVTHPKATTHHVLKSSTTAK
jgi:hypothetical protein